MSKMSARDIELVVVYYIGLAEFGYSGELSDYYDLRAFYQVDCDLDINPAENNSDSVANQFADILISQSPQNQARILDAVLDRFHIRTRRRSDTRKPKLRDKIIGIIAQLQSESTLIEMVSPQSPSETVKLAIDEADNLIRRGRASSAVDRMHTALHTRLRDLCDDEDIKYKKDPSLNESFKLLQKTHMAFSNDGPRKQDISKILNSLANILDALNPIRNRASLSHPPEDELLEESEAVLAMNAARSIFNYVEEKMSDYHRMQELS